MSLRNHGLEPASEAHAPKTLLQRITSLGGSIDVITFVRLLLVLLDGRTKTRLCIASGAMLVLGMLEGVGLACVGPLVLLINRAAGSPGTASADRWIQELFGVHTALGGAGVLGGLAFAAFVAKGIFAVLLLRWNLGVILEAEAAMARRLLHSYLTAPHSFRLRRPTSELQRNVHESVRQVFEAAMTGLVAAGADVVIIFVVALLLLVLQPVVAVAGAVYFGIVAFGYQRLVHGRAQEAGDAVLQGWNRSFKIVQQSLRSAKVLALSHRHQTFVDELHSVKMTMAQRLRTMILLFQIPRYYLEISLIVGIGVVSALLFLTRDAAGALAGLALFLAAGLRLLPSINRLLVAASSARSSQSALEQIATDLASLEHDEPPIGDSLPAAPIRLRDVYFTHEQVDVPSLRGVSLTIDPGELIGFAGPSGAGKTTLVDVVLGLLEPSSGEVLLGEQPLPTVRREWQRSVGYVPQEVVLIEATLARNVALGVPEDAIDFDRVRRALALAQLDDFVARLPGGLDALVGEDGSSVSGGQRQRIGIARALYDDVTTLVLDEATSALDAPMEAQVIESIVALRGRVTVLVIAHRISTLRMTDRIYLLDSGRVVETGSFKDLLARSPRFAQLAQAPAG